MPAEVADRNREAFVARYGGVFEHSPWLAEAAFDAGPPDETATAIHTAMRAALARADNDAKLALIRAHPDLAGKLAQAGRLTADSTAEQHGAGLDMLTDDERRRFTELNDAYRERFGFPFVIAVRGLAKTDILAAFERRLANDRDAEIATALTEIERIALLRLRDLLP